MFSLTISFGPQGTMWTLMFKTKESAEKAQAHVDFCNTDKVSVSDDFGQNARIEMASFHGVMLEDMELSKLAHIERALHQARLQAKAQEMAEGDATLRAARARSGPAIIDPTGMRNGGGFPRIG